MAVLAENGHGSADDPALVVLRCHPTPMATRLTRTGNWSAAAANDYMTDQPVSVQRG